MKVAKSKRKNCTRSELNDNSKKKNIVNNKTKKHKVVQSQIQKRNSKVKRVEHKHSADVMVQALDAVRQGKSFKEAAQTFGIPKSTLFDKFKNKSPLETKKGPPTILSEQEENIIVQWIIYCQSKGFPVTKFLLLDRIQVYLNDLNRKTVFKNNRPGKWWYKAFMQRHSNLSVRVAQNLTATRASVSETSLRRWFDHITQHLESKDLIDIDPARIFNLDESSFMLHPKDTSVIAEKGSNSVYQIIGGNEKAALTVLFIAAASGTMPPPMILFDSKNTPKKDILKSIPQGWV